MQASQSKPSGNNSKTSLVGQVTVVAGHSELMIWLTFTTKSQIIDHYKLNKDLS